MLANRQQWCGIAGWTTRQFDAAVVKGFPAQKKSSSRGDNWQVDTRDGIAWIVEQEAPNHRPRHSGKIDFSDAPPGWEAFKAVELVENPFERVAMLTALTMLYGLPRLAANVAADEGASLDQTFKISGGVLVAVWTWCLQRLPYWPQDEDAVSLVGAAFEPINWPHLAVKAGSPDWEPPAYAAGWTRVTPEEHAECVAHGEAIEAKYAELERNDAA